MTTQEKITSSPLETGLQAQFHETAAALAEYTQANLDKGNVHVRQTHDLSIYSDIEGSGHHLNVDVDGVTEKPRLLTLWVDKTKQDKDGNPHQTVIELTSEGQLSVDNGGFGSTDYTAVDPETGALKFEKGIGPKRQKFAIAVLKMLEESLAHGSRDT